jgi:DNA-directed RNA polymerase specialized sigma24 family protein
MNSTAATFATTHWSMVLAAGQSADAQASQALEQLCRAYWYPLFAYVRRRGYALEEARDLTQEFFFRLLQKNRLSFADPRRGRFRSFLLSSANHFLANEWDRGRAVKRGGRVTFLPLEDDSVEQRCWEGGLSQASPEQVYEHCWALALLEKVLGRLRAEAVAAGRAKQFEELKVFLTGEQDSGYAELAVKLDTTEGALKMAMKRLRTRYGQLLREEIAHTVADPEEAEDELRHLCTVLSW